MVESQEIERIGSYYRFRYHDALFDKVMDMGGNFEILVFDIGKRKTDPSYARLRIKASNKEKLHSILSELHRLGARPLEIKDVYLVPADSDRVVPKGFYTTSNHPTQIKYNGEWIPVESIEMDFLIVVDPVKKRAVAVALGKIRKGDLVVVGEQGVSVSYPERPRESSYF